MFQALLDVIPKLITQVAPMAPIVPFDPANPSDAARRALLKVATDLSVDPATLMASYVTRYGFDPASGFRGASIRNPALEIGIGDLGCVIKVAESLGTKPSHVLAVWISEGKHPHRQLLRGDPLTLTVPELLAASEPKRVRAYARSEILYQAFGLDHFTDYIPRGAANGDNLLNGADGDHDAAFGKGIEEIRSAGIRGLSGLSTDEATRYFRDSGGGLRIAMPPMGGPTRDVTVSIRSTSLASWLYLQAALFQVYRQKAETAFRRLYHDVVSLDEAPWVTYAFWNGGTGAMNAFFSGGANSMDAITKRFGSDTTVPEKLSAEQINRYYNRGAYSGSGQSVAALANAIVVKYLIECIDPWFG